MNTDSPQLRFMRLIIQDGGKSEAPVALSDQGEHADVRAGGRRSEYKGATVVDTVRLIDEFLIGPVGVGRHAQVARLGLREPQSAGCAQPYGCLLRLG